MRFCSAVVLFALVALAGCSSGEAVTTARAAATPLYAPNALPSGPVGQAIRYGRDIVANTQREMPANVKAGMSCAACHVASGTQARGGTLAGVYAEFPQWNKRSHRVITLQDRIAECFLYSMNGRPPAYASKQMIAIVSYIAWISRGTPTLAKKDPAASFIVPLPKVAPNVTRGGALYEQKCSSCHQASGAGIAGAFPPLWGATSFNRGAGMAHLNRMTGFVHYNMPQNAPGSLDVRDSYDISAFVLSHQRPTFDASASIGFPPQAAASF